MPGTLVCQPLVDRDEAAFVESRYRRPRRLSASVFGVRPAAASRCEPVSVLLAVRRLDRQGDAVAVGLRHATRVGLQQDLDAVLAQDGGDGVGDVGVFAAEQALAALHDGHPAAEAAEHLAELQPDVAAAEDDQVVGNRVEFHDRGRVVGPGPCRSPVRCWDRRAARRR